MLSGAAPTLAKEGARRRTKGNEGTVWELRTKELTKLLFLFFFTLVPSDLPANPFFTIRQQKAAAVVHGCDRVAPDCITLRFVYAPRSRLSHIEETAGLTVMRGAASLLHLKGLFYPNTKQTNRYVTYKCRYEP